ncbi:uncharacterized protein B0I36DRAFT_428147, partial [Microdochium trichocladiopsis]
MAPTLPRSETSHEPVAFCTAFTTQKSLRSRRMQGFYEEPLSRWLRHRATQSRCAHPFGVAQAVSPLGLGASQAKVDLEQRRAIRWSFGSMARWLTNPMQFLRFIALQHIYVLRVRLTWAGSDTRILQGKSVAELRTTDDRRRCKVGRNQEKRFTLDRVQSLPSDASSSALLTEFVHYAPKTCLEDPILPGFRSPLHYYHKTIEELVLGLPPSLADVDRYSTKLLQNHTSRRQLALAKHYGLHYPDIPQTTSHPGIKPAWRQQMAESKEEACRQRNTFIDIQSKPQLNFKSQLIIYESTQNE